MDLSKCKYCGSRTDVFYMFGESVCYDCAIELLKGYDYIKIEEKDGENVFYAKRPRENKYNKIKDIFALCTIIEEYYYSRDGWLLDHGRPVRIEYNCRDARCEAKVKCPFSRDYKWSCFNDTYNLYIFIDEITREIITICEDCFLERIGIEKVLAGLKYNYCEENFYIYYCEGKPISAVRYYSPIWEKEKQIAKVIDYCIDNFGLQLELVKGVEYTDKYYKALGDRDDIAKEHQFYRVLSYKKLEKIHSTEVKSKKEKKKELEELKEFVRKSLNF